MSIGRTNGLRSGKAIGSVNSAFDSRFERVGEVGPVLLLGAPGVGKGTQAEILAKFWGVPKISTGDILRANVSNGTALGREADKIMKDGRLVPDRIMTEMVAERLEHPDTVPGFILDGFPRTVGQAQWLRGHLNSNHTGSVLRVVVLQMKYERIVERIAYRVVCPQCKSVYNTVLAPPRRRDLCDKDNSQLEQRSDDGIEVFNARLEVYRRETEPLIEYYRSQCSAIEIDAGRSPSFITSEIITRLFSSHFPTVEQASQRAWIDRPLREKAADFLPSTLSSAVDSPFK